MMAPRTLTLALPLALLFLLGGPAGASIPTGTRSKTVSTLLDAKWATTPFILEMAEGLREDIGSEAYWDMVDFISEKESTLDATTDAALYDAGIEFCSRYLSWTQMQMLKLSLSLRSYSPRLETFQQIAADQIEVGEKGCDQVVHFKGKMNCGADKIDPSKGADAKSPRLFSIDHTYPHSEEGAPVAIFYGRPGAKGFRTAHERLKTLASEGKLTYVLRPYLRARTAQQTRLSGYGVELQIKKTEYKAQDDAKLEDDSAQGAGGEDGNGDEVDGFVFDTLKEKNPEKKEKLDEFKGHLVEQKNDLAPLKVWQLQDLSMQTAQKIMKQETPEEQLRLLADLSENFPSKAKKLSKVKVSKDLKKEVKKNAESFMMNMNVQPGDAALYVNGMHFDMDYVDIFTIMDSLKSDGKVLDGLGGLGLTDEQANKMMSQDFSANKQTYGIDIRDSAINWINDIENDKVYKSWSSDLSELLRPTFPGMLRSIKRNLFNVVIMCNPSRKEIRPVLKLLESFYVHRAPTRIGIVFAVNDDTSATGENDAGVALLDAYNYIAQEKAPYDAFAFMTDVFSKLDESDELTPELVKTTFKATYGKGLGGNVDVVFEEESEYDVGRQLAKDFVARSGFKVLPQVLMNGVPLEQEKVNGEDFEEALMMSLMKVTNELQKAVYRNQLKESDDVMDYLMKQPSIMPRLNDRVLKNDQATYIDLTGQSENSGDFLSLPKSAMAATMADSLSYLRQKDDARKLRILTIWVAADLETEIGREVLASAVSHLKGSSIMRVGVIHNTKKSGLISRAVQAALQTLDNVAAKHLIAKVLKADTVKRLESGKKSLTDYDIPGADMAALAKVTETLKDSKVFAHHAAFAKSVLESQPGQISVIVNGKQIGPLDEDEVFAADDFNLLEKFTMAQYGDKMVTNFYSFMDTKAPGTSDTAMKIVALLLTRTESKSRSAIVSSADKHSVIKMEPQFADRPAFDIVAIVDPVSRGAQKIAPLLMVLKDVLNAKISVFLNCIDKHSEMPQKSYYRTVLDSELKFDSNGKLTNGPMAKFLNLPEETILTMHHHIPDNWLIEPIKSVYDLDNIKLSTVEGNVHSEFELEYLLMEGHCFETLTGNPPRGLQLTLGTDQKAVVMDTIVMANLGYLQLKSSPGRWIMNLREGRSSELYDIVSHEGTASGKDETENIQVLIDSFKTKIVKLRVQKKADKRNEDLLEADAEPEEEGLWGSLTKTLTGSPPAVAGGGDDEVLNIFCLASGHLYERLLKIMIHTTLSNTKAPVKFWILKNYLSPSLKEFLPYYAAKYGFEFEYVQYKWPRWLNQQKEKQRMIWGYKILFLDVMFPLDVKKIIFVDTDQIVRADLTELRDMDLKGAPYGYTPFCDTNTEMEGFRFWKSGYWKNHLAGRPYHISALYVVDLVKFRKIAAGDRLRGQYQALSQDPNSLANLDQDLPNNMIHQVPIFSLPQDWLWCETWCGQEGKKTAKNIDLCNNPLTKESKLDAARRIVSEWTGIDDEIADFWELEKKGIQSEGAKSKPGHSEHTEL